VIRVAAFEAFVKLCFALHIGHYEKMKRSFSHTLKGLGGGGGGGVAASASIDPHHPKTMGGKRERSPGFFVLLLCL
jgi:hypothetical protein